MKLAASLFVFLALAATVLSAPTVPLSKLSNPSAKQFVGGPGFGLPGFGGGFVFGGTFKASKFPFFGFPGFGGFGFPGPVAF